MLQIAEIERMTVEEQLQTMELLWTSLTRTPEAVPSPDWHGKVVADRLAEIEQGKGEFLTLSEAKARLQRPRP